MNAFVRKWHRIVSVFVMIPFFVVVVTGILLSTRGFVTWVQPSYPKFKSELSISFAEILQQVMMVPEAQIKTWDDVAQIDIRPGAGNIRVRSKANNWEIQLRGDTGEIMNSAPRRVSFLVQLHEGTWFGEWVRFGWFFPSALGMLFLLLSGAWLAAKHYGLKERTR